MTAFDPLKNLEGLIKSLEEAAGIQRAAILSAAEGSEAALAAVTRLENGEDVRAVLVEYLMGAATRFSDIGVQHQNSIDQIEIRLRHTKKQLEELKENGY